MNDGTKRFWEATYRQHIAKMIGVCYRYTNNRQTAEDLAHDAFLVAIAKSSSFENRGAFEAWFRRIVVNVALQYLRQQKKQRMHEDRMAYDPVFLENPEDDQRTDETTFSEAELLDVIGQLPEHHKRVFNLYVVDHFTHAQIAAQLDISEGTSKSHLARARKKIREILTEKTRNNKKRKRFLWLLLLPDWLWNADSLFTESLKNFEIQPQNLSPIDTFDFSGSSTPGFKPSTGFPEYYLKTDIAALAMSLNLNLAVVVFLQVTAYQKASTSGKTASAMVVAGGLSALNSTKMVDKKVEKPDTTTDTFSKNTIISREKTNTNKDMKKMNTFGALLLTSSALAFDSTSLLKASLLPVSPKNQTIAETNAPAVVMRSVEPLKPDAKPNTEKLFGTFYASELYWSSVNNELYLLGNDVKVNLNSQKFTGSGRFSFINQVNYLVVDGVPAKLNETIKLADKKYRLVKLTEAEAIKKYGDKGKLIVEITVTE